MAAIVLPYPRSGSGLDVHRDTAVPNIECIDLDTETKTFLTFTEDLYDLAE